MSIFSDMIATGLDLVRDMAGECVIYRRGSDWFRIERAVPLGGQRPRDVEGSYTLEFDELEWGIKRSDLKIGGTEVQPAEFDLIEWTYKGRKLTFKVLPKENSQCWRWSDRGESQYRVFTKLDADVLE